jgi:hypothetical protein
MFCASCGTDLGAGSIACPRCGATPQGSGAAVAADMGRRVADSSRDALRAVRTLVVDPVGGLSGAFADLGGQRAGGAGAALCAAFVLAGAIGFTLGVRRALGVWVGISGMSGAGVFVKACFGLLVAPLVFAAGGLLVRLVAGAGEAGLGTDLFVAGAALTPVGLASLLGGLLGPANYGVAFVLYLVAFSYLVLILYTGLTALARVRPSVAAPCVPALILLALWSTKVFITALL